MARTTIAGTAWSYGAFVLGKAFVFLSTILLARVLVPQDFGLVALGLLVLRFLETMSDLGVGPALIYRTDDTERTSSVAFGINLVMGGLLTAVMIAGAPIAASFFHEPRLEPVVSALAVSCLLIALRNVHQSRLKRELEFRRRFLPEIARTAAKGGVSVILAWLGFGVWSLVWGQLAGELTSTLLYWWVARWRPRITFDRDIARQLLSYGGQIVLLKLISVGLNNVDYLIIGRRLDAVQLGFYVIAFRIPELVILSLCNMASQVLFPVYSRLQADRRALRRGFLKALRYMALITVPAGVGLAIIAPEFVQVFYTSRWAPSIPLMQLLALSAILTSLNFNVGDVYKAIGRPSILNWIGAMRLAVAVPVLWYAAGHGILGVAVGQTAVTLVFTIVGLGVASRVLATGFRDVATALRPALLSTAVMAVGALTLRGLLPSAAAMWILVPTGAALYLLTLHLSAPKTLRDAARIFRPANRPAGTPYVDEG